MVEVNKLVENLSGNISTLKKILKSPEYKKEFISSLDNPDFKSKLLICLEGNFASIIQELIKNGGSKTKEDVFLIKTIGALNGQKVDFKNLNYDQEAKSIIFSEQVKQIKKYFFQILLDSGLSQDIISEIRFWINNNINDIDYNNDGIINPDEIKKLKRIFDLKISKLQKYSNLKNLEKEKLKNTIEKILKYNFYIEDKLRFQVNLNSGETIYESLDMHKPDILKYKESSNNKTLHKLDKQYLDKLELYSKNYKKELYSLNPDKNETKENLKKMIIEYFETNKDVLSSSLGIKEINHLTPIQAAKLVSLITMDKLSYNYEQALTPMNEKGYLGGVSPESKEIYFKEKKMYSDFLYECSLKQQTYKDEKIRNMSLSDFLNNLILKNESEIEEINRKIKDSNYKGADDKFISDNISIISELYQKFSSLFNKAIEVDKLSVDDLLKGGKGVCRNYGVANEKLFEALKELQDKNNNQLRYSSLVRFVDSNIHSLFLGYTQSNLSKEDLKDSDYNGHMWNMLITIDKNGIIHKTHIDPTHADGGDGERNKNIKFENIKGKVVVLDKTYDRLLQDIIKDGGDHNKIFDKLMKAIVLSDSLNIDESYINSIRLKVVNYINSGIINIEKFSEYTNNIKFNKGNLSDTVNLLDKIRFDFIGENIKNNPDLALKILGKVEKGDETMLLKLCILLIKGEINKEEAIKIINEDKILKSKIDKYSLDEFKEKFNNYFGIGDFFVNNKIITFNK